MRYYYFHARFGGGGRSRKLIISTNKEELSKKRKYLAENGYECGVIDWRYGPEFYVTLND